MRLFADALQDEFAAWPLGLLGADGGAVGEVGAIAASLEDPDDEAFAAAWIAAADRAMSEGRDAERRGHTTRARGHYLRATQYGEVAIHMWYGTPVAERLVRAFDHLSEAFDRAVALDDPPAEQLSIPFDGHSMPGYFLPAAGSAHGARPVVICVNGYDATMADEYLATAVDVRRRGLHCVLFDGPGQGAMLVRDGVHLVPDWERVVTPVVDAVVERPDVDASRIALVGWSLGGHLAARAAAAEPRLAACVLDPPSWSLLDGMPQLAQHMGVPAEAAAAIPELTADDAALMLKGIEANRGLRWKVAQRGFWVNGVPDLRGYLQSLAGFTLDGVGERIACPTLATAAESDPMAAAAPAFLERLSCPTTLLRFTSAEGAGDHCELMNRWLANQRILDWLDDLFTGRSARRAPA